MAYSRPVRGGKLEAQEAWLKECFFRHRGNAEVVRQDLLRELSIDVSLRTVERAVAPFRRLLTAEAKATVRFETAPGHQLQIDFGELRVPIADERVRVYLFVATLGYSRRCHVEAFRHERQSSWFRGLEGTFRHFGGVTKEVLTDNPRALVIHHDAATREVEFNDRFQAFAAYWGFRPRACAPYRARTKGKDERGVGYVKRNAIAGHLCVMLHEIASGEHPFAGNGVDEGVADRIRRQRPGRAGGATAGPDASSALIAFTASLLTAPRSARPPTARAFAAGLHGVRRRQ